MLLPDQKASKIDQSGFIVGIGSCINRFLNLPFKFDYLLPLVHPHH